MPASNLVRDAAIYSPNTQFTEFTARKLSNPRFRGRRFESGQSEYHDLFRRVPQLNSNTSSIDLLDVEQVEFVAARRARSSGGTRSRASSPSPACGRR